MKWTLALTAGLLASACTTLDGRIAAPLEPAAPACAEAPLYGRDGSIVDGAVERQVPQRELAANESGRTYILELYQKAIDERDALRREVEALGAQSAQAAEQCAARDAELATLRARIVELERENQRRVDENVDLAARLVTAQIRRLQAEKVLLEARLAIEPPVAQAAEKK